MGCRPFKIASKDQMSIIDCLGCKGFLEWTCQDWTMICLCNKVSVIYNIFLVITYIISCTFIFVGVDMKI